MKSYLIYKHTNKINGKCYIGQTCYTNPTHRWHSDGSGYKSQQKFYRAILKYGWENFEHQVLIENLTKQEADELEIAYINQFDSIENGYNLLIGGSGQTTQGEAVYQLSLDKQILATYSSIREAARQLYPEDFNSARSNIGRCCNGKLRQYRGFGWCLASQYEQYKFKLCNGKTAGKTVYQLNSAGNIINIFSSYHEAGLALSTTAAYIKYCCERLHNGKGYYWCRASDLNLMLERINNEKRSYKT